VKRLPAGWAWADLAEVCTSITDGDHQAPPQVPFGVPFLVIGNIRNGVLDFTDCRYVPQDYFMALSPIRRPQKNDVLYSLVGSYGIPAQVKDDTAFCVQRHIGILRPSAEINSTYLALVLSDRAVFQQATEYATGTAQLTVPLSGLRRIRIPLPPRAEQQRIVAAIEEQLSRLDTGVMALERGQQNLKRMTDALRQTLVLGNLATNLGNGSAQSSELPQLPDGWYWTNLGSLIAVGPQNGLYLPAGRYGRGVPILRINDFQNDWVRPKEDLRLVSADPEQTKTYALASRDLVINRVNSMTHLGKCVIVTKDLAGTLFESNMMRIRLTSDIEPSYLALFLQSSVGRSFLLKNAKWAVNQASINQADVRATSIAVPPLEAQRRIVSTYGTISRSLSTITEDIQTNFRRSNSLRWSILTTAFSGKLVPLDLTEEPAPVLLERIVTERASSNRKNQCVQANPQQREWSS
jgi:type I restriction enzyme, S subunit